MLLNTEIKTHGHVMGLMYKPFKGLLSPGLCSVTSFTRLGVVADGVFRSVEGRASSGPGLLVRDGVPVG